MEKKLKIDIISFPPLIRLELCKKCGKIHPIFSFISLLDPIFDYDLFKDDKNHYKLIVNEKFSYQILEDFINYKIKCISSLEYFLKENNIKIKDSKINDEDKKINDKDNENNKINKKDDEENIIKNE